MRWTSDYVWSKILQLVPYAKYANMALPEALKSAAVEAFLINEESGSNGMHGWRDYVIATCIKELNADGFLSFGYIDEDWK